MTDINKLMQLFKDSGMTLTAIAKKTDIQRETLYNRLKGKGEFKASEIYNISKVFSLNNIERDSIFFSD